MKNQNIGHCRAFLSGLPALLKSIYQSIPEGFCRQSQPYEKAKAVETPDTNIRGWISGSGFTLIELLVVVLIIGVLTAVALPKYQTAVEKSRYAGLMPLAKSVKNAEEAVFMERGNYTGTLTDLSVSVPTGTDTTITPVTNDNESYVRASKTGLSNRLVMYMAKSSRYPNEIHCEAIQENDRAKQICLSLGANATKVNGTADSTGYDTYVLEGTGTDAGAISSGVTYWNDTPIPLSALEAAAAWLYPDHELGLSPVVDDYMGINSDGYHEFDTSIATVLYDPNNYVLSIGNDKWQYDSDGNLLYQIVDESDRKAYYDGYELVWQADLETDESTWDWASYWTCTFGTCPDEMSTW